ncbi:aldehyde dehydrogenase family protein [Candidatus Woesearchaeota archaeon]|nr:aldehyde dehydrogenase family protein [Candidatus Woesearchaeota archaeon]
MRFQNFVRGEMQDSAEGVDLQVTDYSGKGVVATVPDSGRTELVEARIFAYNEGHKVDLLPLEDRIGLVHEMISRTLSDSRLLENVALVHGTPVNYLSGTADSLRTWADDLGRFVENVDRFSVERDGVHLSERSLVSPYFIVAAGNDEVYETPFIVGQSILGGAHAIIRPSANDIAAHILFEKIAEMGLPYLAQKLSWSSLSKPEMVQEALAFSKGFSIFSSNAAYERIVRTVVGDRVIKDLSIGRSSRRYGSGHSIAIVGNGADIDQAADELVYASARNKGNKCWAVTAVYVHEDVYDEFVDALENRAKGLKHGSPTNPKTDLPRFHESALRGILDSGLSPRFGRIFPDKNDIDLMIYELPSSKVLEAQEVSLPVIALLPYSTYIGAVKQIRDSMHVRGTDKLLSLGVFGTGELADYLSSRIPHDTLKLNMSLGVDVFKPHQGSYFLLDVMRK